MTADLLTLVVSHIVAFMAGFVASVVGCERAGHRKK